MPRLLIHLALLIVLTACSGCETDLTTGAEIGDETSATAEPDSAPATAPAIVQTALDLVNAQRVAGCRCGDRAFPPVAPLAADERLNRAAAAHATDQATAGRMQHRGTDGSTVGQRVSRAGYAWRAVAENVARNYPDVDAVITGWLASPAHCANIMNGRYTHVGIGVDNRYWAQVFAAQ